MSRPRAYPEPKDWRPVFLESVKRTGGVWKAADAAGIHPRIAQRHMHDDPAFKDAVDDARQYHADHLEEQLELQSEKTGSPVGYIVRLKALRPNEYIEKHAVMNLTATVALDTNAGLELLQAMLGRATGQTVQALQSPIGGPGVIDVNPIENGGIGT